MPTNKQWLIGALLIDGGIVGFGLVTNWTIFSKLYFIVLGLTLAIFDVRRYVDAKRNSVLDHDSDHE